MTSDRHEPPSKHLSYLLACAGCNPGAVMGFRMGFRTLADATLFEMKWAA